MKKCLWCLEEEPNVTFYKKAHTIPKSLGGQNYNPNVCDNCNEYFGNRENNYYSIEEALKETFIITRQKLLSWYEPKKKVGRFKSKFFEVKERNGKYRLSIKSTFRFDSSFQINLCRSFKRGLYKMYLEELNRQKLIGFDEKYNFIRRFARYNENDLPVFYFIRSLGVILTLKDEAETPKLLFERMKYLYSNDFFAEIEFLGHVFGFPISEFGEIELENYMKSSAEAKKGSFKNAKTLVRLIDVDFTLAILND